MVGHEPGGVSCDEHPPAYGERRPVFSFSTRIVSEAKSNCHRGGLGCAFLQHSSAARRIGGVGDRTSGCRLWVLFSFDTSFLCDARTRKTWGLHGIARLFWIGAFVETHCGAASTAVVGFGFLSARSSACGDPG